MTITAIDQADAKIESLYSQIDDWTTDYECGDVSFEFYQNRVIELQHQIDRLMAEIAIAEGAMEEINEEFTEETMTLPAETIEELAALDAQIHILEQRIEEINEDFASGDSNIDEIWLVVEVTRVNAEMNRLINRIIELEGQGA